MVAIWRAAWATLPVMLFSLSADALNTHRHASKEPDDVAAQKKNIEKLTARVDGQKAAAKLAAKVNTDPTAAYTLQHENSECTSSTRLGVNRNGNTPDQCYVAVLADSRCGLWFEVSHDGGGWCICNSGDCTEFIPDGGEHMYKIAGPDGGAGAATGDPHLVNMHGERFDLMKPGKVTLINIPRGKPADYSFLTVEAEARHLGGPCADIYFQTLNVTGKWTTSDLHFKAEGSPNTNAAWWQFGPVELKVAHGRTEKGVKYLNFYVKHLGRAGAAVGGLLGEDDSAEAATPSAGCRKTISLDKIATRTAAELPGASVAIAAM